jgi:hypothetical protein
MFVVLAKIVLILYTVTMWALIGSLLHSDAPLVAHIALNGFYAVITLALTLWVFVKN